MFITHQGKMVSVNIWQKAFHYYPKQQDCIVEVLTQMEINKIIPDEGNLHVTLCYYMVRTASSLP